MLSGQIVARDEINLAFRIDGKLVERAVNVGDGATSGQLIARLDSQNEQNQLRSSQADIASAEAALTQAEKVEGRQRELLARGITTRVLYDQALQQLQTTQAQLDAAQARLRIAQDRLKYTSLETESPGIITEKGAEPGEIVRAGQMIVRMARAGEKDALFHLPAQLLMLFGERIPRDSIVQVALLDNPNIKAIGQAREVAPHPDPATRSYPVRVGLINPPEEMFLGLSVTGSLTVETPPLITVPTTALIQADGRPSVWIFDPASNTVALRSVELISYDAVHVVVSQGLKDGEIVVTAGVNVLYPGQKVKLLSNP
jgi:RND family efflux transporter MFP subunit